MSRTTRAKACWSSSLPVRPSRSAPAFSSIQSRHRSTMRSPLFGAARPVSFSRTISASASSIGASARSRDVGEIGLGVFVLEHRAEIVGDAGHGAGADRLDARLLDGVVDGARLLALGRELRVDAEIVAGALQRHGIAEAARHRDVGGGRLLGQLGQPGAVAGQRRLVLGEGDLELVVAGDRAHADRDGALEAVGFRAGLRPVARVVAGTRHRACC